MQNSLQLCSTFKDNNTLELSLQETEVPAPGPDEVLVRVEAAPLNPTDLATLLGPADVASFRATGSDDSPQLTADVPEQFMGFVATRLNKAKPVGSEGAGVVVAAGDSSAAQAMIGKTVSFAAGQTYSQYRIINILQCIPLPADVTPRQAASAFINPLTALGFVETMKTEGHKALVNTAAASSLGIMLNRICQADGIDLVNIVRKPEQEAMLREEIGAKYVVNSSSETFKKDLTKALIETGATIGFDAAGGGTLANDMLSCMEAAAARDMEHYDHYGSTVFKQVYIYGGLDLGPTVLNRGYGFAWSLGAWLLTNFLFKAGHETIQRLQKRVADELTTTFATNYTAEISLKEALDKDTLHAYAARKTGEKYLINPQK